jgi:hypothetical protein
MEKGSVEVRRPVWHVPEGLRGEDNGGTINGRPVPFPGHVVALEMIEEVFEDVLSRVRKSIRNGHNRTPHPAPATPTTSVAESHKTKDALALQGAN